MLLFFFNDTATTEIYTLSLHDALPICPTWRTAAWWCSPATPPTSWPTTSTACRTCSCTIGAESAGGHRHGDAVDSGVAGQHVDRKSTRLNSSHANISYAVFCLKKKRLI